MALEKTIAFESQSGKIRKQIELYLNAFQLFLDFYGNLT